jgi:hypothetical protein
MKYKKEQERSSVAIGSFGPELRALGRGLTVKGERERIEESSVCRRTTSKRDPAHLGTR